MLVKDFVELLPGPAALEGAVVAFGPGSRSSFRLEHGSSFLSFYYWEVIEYPPLYADPSARYCGWCKERLSLGYTPNHGLEENCCPAHGRAVPILHAGTFEPPPPSTIVLSSPTNSISVTGGQLPGVTLYTWSLSVDTGG